MKKFFLPLLFTCYWVFHGAAVAEPGATLQETQRIELPGVQGRIDHMAVDLPTHRLFVVALGNNTVEVIDLQTKRLIKSLTGLREPQGLLLVPEVKQLIVTNGESVSARVYDSVSLEPLKDIRLREDNDNIRYDPDSKRSYIGCGAGGEGALAVVDTQTDALIGEIGLSGHPESFQLERRGKRIFVNIPSARKIEVVDREKQQVMEAWAVPARGNFPMALDEEHARLFVGTRGPARLLVLDTGSSRVVAELDSVRDADDISYDADTRRIYVSGGEGFVFVFEQIDPNQYRLLDKVATRKGARTSLFVPEWQTLFVALPPGADGNAEIRAYKVTP
ncbi:MAG: YncE family protein [Betaproteobacteria bacterium]|nr:YncE family protein [Betaproteobacteria bacterium]